MAENNSRNKWLSIFIPIIVMLMVTFGGIVYGLTARTYTDALELTFEKRMVAVELQLQYMANSLAEIFKLLELRIK